MTPLLIFIFFMLFGAKASDVPPDEAAHGQRELQTSRITFFAIGDVPYNDVQARNLPIQMQNIPANADFVIHLGDLRSAATSSTCSLSQYQNAANMLRQSPVPVFVVMGDNDWPDCSKPANAYGYWKGEFLNFASRYWNHNFVISRQSDIEENFSFVHKGNLFIGVNTVGRSVLGKTAWNKRMTSQANWVIQTVRNYRKVTVPGTQRVFLFGQSDPTITSSVQAFLDQLKSFTQNELKNSVPFLYLHGDGHKWRYKTYFMNQKSWLEIMVTGGTSEPPLKFVIDTKKTNLFPNTQKAFPYDRDLGNSTLWNTPK